MTIPVTCGACQAKFKAPDAAAGKRGKCPKCGATVTVPGAQSQAGTAIQKATPAPPSPVAGDAPAKSQALAAVSFAMSLLGWAVRTGHVVITKTTSVRAKSISQPQSPDIIDADFTTPATTGRQQTQSCPFCGEEILAVARKCKHCGETLDPVLRAAEEGRRGPAMPLYQPPAAAGPINVTVNPTLSQNVDVKTTTTTIVAGAVKPKSGGCCGCLILIVIAFFAMAFLGRGGTSSPGGAGHSSPSKAGATVQQPSNIDAELPPTESGSLENSTDSPPASSQPAPAQSQSNSSYFGNGGGASHRLRTWIYEDGTELRASFVSFANGQVTLRTEDGKTIKTAIEKLSASDQRDIHHVRVD